MKKSAASRFACCPCSGKNLSKLVQPSILAILSQGPLHGYAITEQIAQTYGGPGTAPKHPGVYRLLRRMEEKGLLRSESGASQTGPTRRVYAITADGKTCLQHWILSLCDYQKAIAAFLKIAQP